MTKQTKAPTLYHLFLPASHPFMKMSDEEFENLWGPHVERHVPQQIPLAVGETADGKEG